jgi:hypothetical protein
MRPESMESGSKSSNFQRRREDLSSYLADGWWSEVSVGCHAFAAWRGDYERLPETLAGLHYVAFVTLMLKNVAEILS